MLGEQPRQMSCPYPEPVSKISNRSGVQNPLIDQAQGPFNGCSGAIPCGAKWCGFGATPQTGAISGPFCRRSRWVVGDIFPVRVFCGAHRTAVDFCRADGSEEPSVKTRVAAQSRGVARFEI